MGNSELEGRRVIVMPLTADGLRGQQRDSVTKAEALVLRDAIAGALDILDLFQHEGSIVLVANGEIRNVNSELLRWLIEATFMEKHVVRTFPGLRHEVEYRPVNPSEMAVRALLTKEPRDGGLVGVLPPLVIERPQVLAREEKPEVATSNLPEVQVELTAGAAQVARHGNTAERTRLEGQRGAEVVARNEGRQAVVDPSAREPIAEESYPAYLPDKTNDGAADPARPPQA
jgi:hypothetical protein